MRILSSSPLRASTLAVLAVACHPTVNVGDITETNADDTDAGPSDPGDSPATTGPDATDTTPDDPDTTTGSTDTMPADPGTTTDAGDTTSDGASTTGTDTNASTSEGPDSDTSTGETSSETTTGAGAGACPEGWTRARTVTITNEPEKPLTSYQTLVNVVWDDDMQADFSDLRFTDGEGTLLPYWIEDYNAPVDATVWVRVPTITAADTTDITMCYGNPDAPDASDGESTFVFFDGFDAATLDANKWVATSTVSFSGGALRVEKGSVYSKTSPGSFPNLMVEAKARHLPQAAQLYGGLYTSSAQAPADPSLKMNLGGSFTAIAGMPAMQVLAGSFQNQGCCDDKIAAVYGMAVDEANVYVFAKRQFSATAKASWKKPFFIGLGHGYMKASGDEDILDIAFDWVLVRKFTSIEPTTAIGPEQNI